MDAVFGLAEEHYAALAPFLAVGSEIGVALEAAC